MYTCMYARGGEGGGAGLELRGGPGEEREGQALFGENLVLVVHHQHHLLLVCRVVVGWGGWVGGWVGMCLGMWWLWCGS